MSVIRIFVTQVTVACIALYHVVKFPFLYIDKLEN